MKLPHSYSLYIVSPKGDRETILEYEKSPNKVRNVARKLKPRLGHRIVITRDQKELPGGAAALDKETYELWLERNQPEFDPFDRDDPRATHLTSEDVELLER